MRLSDISISESFLGQPSLLGCNVRDTSASISHTSQDEALDEGDNRPVIFLSESHFFIEGREFLRQHRMTHWLPLEAFFSAQAEGREG